MSDTGIEGYLIKYVGYKGIEYKAPIAENAFFYKTIKGAEAQAKYYKEAKIIKVKVVEVEDE